jgi:hypothetical protein
MEMETLASSGGERGTRGGRGARRREGRFGEREEKEREEEGRRRGRRRRRRRRSRASESQTAWPGATKKGPPQNSLFTRRMYMQPNQRTEGLHNSDRGKNPLR